MKRALGLLFASILLAATATAESRRIAIILDTSGSMTSTDRSRLTVLLSQIIADLSEPSDQLTVIRLPSGESCSAGPSDSLALRLDPAARSSFKRSLDRFIDYGGGNHFAGPVRTAIQNLSLQPDVERMLLMIADSGGLDACETPLTRELLQLRNSGATVAAINLGSSVGAFDSNPAFSFTTAAQNPDQLVRAVGLVYQKFLGAKKVQAGTVRGAVRPQIHPLCKEAFVVVAADGPVGPLQPDPGNPSAAELDLNYRGGGSVSGLDRVTRQYRIIRIVKPRRGGWAFHAPALSAPAAWVLLQDFSVGLRLVSSTTIPNGLEAPIEVELFDEATGRTIRDMSSIADLDVTLQIDGRRVKLRARPDAPGTLSAPITLNGEGKRTLRLRVSGDLLDFEQTLEAEVRDVGWRIAPQTPESAEVDSPLQLSVRLEPLNPVRPPPTVAPSRIDVSGAGVSVRLRDNGLSGDEAAGDGVYSATWTPNEVREYALTYDPVGARAADPVSRSVQVFGRVELGRALPVQVGPLAGGSVGESSLDLPSASVHGPFQLELSSDFSQTGVALEIHLNGEWAPLGREPLVLPVDSATPLRFPIRFRVGTCPSGGTSVHRLLVRALDGSEPRGALEIPLRLEVKPDPFLQCWWPVLALMLGIAVAALLVHGYWWPSRFPPRLGVWMSPEEDMGEGFFHPIRAAKGSGVGFYRDAAVFIQEDFRLSGKSRRALARLRAKGKRTLLRPSPGASLYRGTADGDWEAVEPEEAPTRFGTVYRNDNKTFYFEIRNG